MTKTHRQRGFYLVLGFVGIGQTGQVDKIAVQLVLQIHGVLHAAFVEVVRDGGDELIVLVQHFGHRFRIGRRLNALVGLSKYFGHV